MKYSKVFFISFGILITAALYVFISPEKAAAVVCTDPNYSTNNPTTSYPRFRTGMQESACPNNAESFIWVGTYWANSTVNVPVSYIRIFYNINDINPQPYTFDIINFQTLSTGNHRCGSNVRVELGGQTQNMYRNPAAGCAIQMPSGLWVNKGMLQQNTAVYGPDIRYVDLTMTQLTASSNAPVRVVAFNWAAKITTREQNTHPVAFWSGNDPSNFITYVQNFKTSCNIPNGNSVPITLRWFDADWGAPPQGLNVFIMYLVDDTTGAHVTPPGGLRSDSYPFGGDNAYGSYNVNIIAGHRYRWIWSGVQKNNGLQVFMPFSEILYGINCSPPTPPTCSISNVVISGGFRLTWSSANATSASINQGVGGVAVNGSRDVGTSALTYTMSVSGPGGSGSCQTTTISPPPPICNSFTFSVSGNNYRLSWDTTNATTVSINQGVGVVSVDGIRDVPQVAITYTLTARNIFNVAVSCSVATPAPPSCTLNNDVSSGSYRVLWTTANATRIDIDQGVGNNLTPLSSGNRNVNLPVGTTTFTATVYNAPGATRNCNTTRTVLPPTCNVVQFYRSGNLAPPQQVLAGSRFRTEVRVNNPNPVALGVNSTGYSFSPNPAPNGDYLSGTNNSVPSIPANSNRVYHSSNGVWSDELIRIDVPGTYQANWIMSYSGGSLTCSGAVEVEVLPLVCVVAASPNSIGMPFQLTITLTNPNYIPIRIDSSNWSAPQANPTSGVGREVAGGGLLNPSGGGASISATPSNLTINSADVTTLDSGNWSVSWTIVTQYTGANPSGCDRADANTARANPYARFYGNDVFAGGGFGSSCTVTAGVDVQGFGVFRNSTPNHANYVGAAAELAIFASGQIDNVLPGSQIATRSPLQALSFANNGSLGSGTLPLGGQFASTLCADNFLSIDTTGFRNVPSNRLNLGGGGSDNFAETAAGSDVDVENGENINNSKRVQLYVNGDVTIRNNIIYTNNGSWTSIDEIPLIRIYATGNIYIDRTVTEISGLFVAGGTIYTCTNGSNIYGNSDIAANCRSRLTIYGAFIANSVELMRVQGSYGLTGAIPETADSGNIAESFIFSPELYLALLSEGSANSDTQFDSILSLPPAF